MIDFWEGLVVLGAVLAGASLAALGIQVIDIVVHCWRRVRR